MHIGVSVIKQNALIQLVFILTLVLVVNVCPSRAFKLLPASQQQQQTDGTDESILPLNRENRVNLLLERLLQRVNAAESSVRPAEDDSNNEDAAALYDSNEATLQNSEIRPSSSSLSASFLDNSRSKRGLRIYYERVPLGNGYFMLIPKDATKNHHFIG